MRAEHLSSAPLRYRPRYRADLDEAEPLFDKLKALVRLSQSTRENLYVRRDRYPILMNAQVFCPARSIFGTPLMGMNVSAPYGVACRSRNWLHRGGIRSALD
jgi:hypothetical protein